MSELARSAYVHVPFCRHRCGYCNFTLVSRRDDLIDAYLDAIEKELSWLKEPRSVQTLFIGGGTPTHLPLEQLSRLLELTSRWLHLPAGAEWSIEANPIDIDEAKIALLAQAGVNRISLGVQSFDPEKLKTLERDHNQDVVARGIDIIKQWISNLSLDLIFAAPNESREVWQRDLATALSFEPKHLSTYGLTFEKGTQFWNQLMRSELKMVDEEHERWMYEHAIETLVAAGFEHYEVSNFARTGYSSKHNQVYWTGGEYYAFGPGAARFIDGRRESNHRSTTTYLKRVLAGNSPIAESEQLDAEMHARERLVFGLRRLAGIDLAAFHAATGFDVSALVGAKLSSHLEQGLFELDAGQLRLTRQGLLISDSIWPDFFSPD